MFPELLLTDAAERLKTDPAASSYDVLGELFEWLNRAGEQEYTPFPPLAPPEEPQSERLFG